MQIRYILLIQRSCFQSGICHWPFLGVTRVFPMFVLSMFYSQLDVKADVSVKDVLARTIRPTYAQSEIWVIAILVRQRACLTLLGVQFNSISLFLPYRRYNPTRNSWQLRHYLFTYIFNHVLFHLNKTVTF